MTDAQIREAASHKVGLILHELGSAVDAIRDMAVDNPLAREMLQEPRTHDELVKVMSHLMQLCLDLSRARHADS